MRTEPGGLYRLTLALSNVQALGPSWLVGALAISYPDFDVVEVERYSEEEAVVLVRWRSAVG